MPPHAGVVPGQVVAWYRAPVKAVIDLWDAGEKIGDIAYEYDIAPEQVDALCQAVVRLPA
jgi:uncharacterized protein (DUF433 family)